MRKYLFPAICAMALGIIAASCGNNSKKAESEAEQAAREDSLRQAEKMAEAEALMQKLEEEPIFDIQTNLGMIKVKLYSKTPKHKANFEKLALSGFYDGILFHRVIDGFMIQGGDPNGNGTGGSDTKIKGEFEGNGVKNDISHVRGTISMARSNANDSASSQFFIVQSDSQYLDGEYAGFGTVTEGMEIVDQICKDTPVQDSNGTVAAEDQPVIESVKVID